MWVISPSEVHQNEFEHKGVITEKTIINRQPNRPLSGLAFIVRLPRSVVVDGCALTQRVGDAALVKPK